MSGTSSRFQRSDRAPGDRDSAEAHASARHPRDRSVSTNGAMKNSLSQLSSSPCAGLGRRGRSGKLRGRPGCESTLSTRARSQKIYPSRRVSGGTSKHQDRPADRTCGEGNSSRNCTSFGHNLAARVLLDRPPDYALGRSAQIPLPLQTPPGVLACSTMALRKSTP